MYKRDKATRTKKEESLRWRKENQSKGAEMQRKEKLGGKREGKEVVTKTEAEEDYFWKHEGRLTAAWLERKQLQAHGLMVPAGGCRGAGITRETLAFSMEPHPMLNMPSGARSF